MMFWLLRNRQVEIGMKKGKLICRWRISRAANETRIPNRQSKGAFKDQQIIEKR